MSAIGVKDPLREAIGVIAAGAPMRDAAGPAAGFPAEAIAALRAAGALGRSVALGSTLVQEWAGVRAVANADASIGRIYDGHLNAVERIAIHAPAAVRDAELERVGAGDLLVGVWGADPVGEEGPPARLGEDGRVYGVKVFCSGAGGLDRAIVLVASSDGTGPPLSAYVDLGGDRVEIDRAWFQGAGMRSSESHRVTFDGARVLALLGKPGAISTEPWFSRDAIRTAACWAGIADAVHDAALDALAERPGSELVGLAAARIATAHATIDLWMAEAARTAGDLDPGSVRARSLALRDAVTQAGRTMVDEAMRAAGSRPFALATRLDRARRDLELLLLQKRLDPLLARHGTAVLETRRPA